MSSNEGVKQTTQQGVYNANDLPQPSRGRRPREPTASAYPNYPSQDYGSQFYRPASRTQRRPTLNEPSHIPMQSGARSAQSHESLYQQRQPPLPAQPVYVIQPQPQQQHRGGRSHSRRRGYVAYDPFHGTGQQDAEPVTGGTTWDDIVPERPQPSSRPPSAGAQYHHGFQQPTPYSAPYPVPYPAPYGYPPQAVVNFPPAQPPVIIQAPPAWEAIPEEDSIAESRAASERVSVEHRQLSTIPQAVPKATDAAVIVLSPSRKSGDSASRRSGSSPSPSANSDPPPRMHGSLRLEDAPWRTAPLSDSPSSSPRHSIASPAYSPASLPSIGIILPSRLASNMSRSESPQDQRGPNPPSIHNGYIDSVSSSTRPSVQAQNPVGEGWPTGATNGPEPHVRVSDVDEKQTFESTSIFAPSPADIESALPVAQKRKSTLEWLVRYSTEGIPRTAYNYFLLRLPSLYFSRVARIFEEADLSLGEIKEMALESASKSKATYGDAFFMEPQSIASPAYDSLKRTWEGFIDSVMREWKTFNIISVLLLSAILTILQIDAAAKDAVTRYTALASLICALISLLYGCMYIIRFGTMRKPYKAAEWALEAKKTGTSIFWNVWVLLAMPAVWLSWSLILYICCIMSFLWRTTTIEPESYLLSNHQLLAIRILITSLLLLGLIYGSLIIVTFSRYGDAMDQAWKKRINGWMEAKFTETFVDEPQPVYTPYSPTYPPPPPPPHGAPVPWDTWTPSSPETKRKDTVDELEEELNMFKEVGRDLSRSMPPDGCVPAFEADSHIALPPPHEIAIIQTREDSLNENAEAEANTRKRGSSTDSRSSERPNLPSRGDQTHSSSAASPSGAVAHVKSSPLVDKSVSEQAEREQATHDDMVLVPLPHPHPPMLVPRPRPPPAFHPVPTSPRDPRLFAPETIPTSKPQTTDPSASDKDEENDMEDNVQRNQHWNINEQTKEHVLSWLSMLPPSVDTPARKSPEDPLLDQALQDANGSVAERVTGALDETRSGSHPDAAHRSSASPPSTGNIAVDFDLSTS